MNPLLSGTVMGLSTENDRWTEFIHKMHPGNRRNDLVHFSGKAQFEVSTSLLRHAAVIQYETRKMLEGAFHYSDGTTFLDHYDQMRRIEKWPLKEHPREPERIVINEKKLHSTIDSMNKEKLTYRTVRYYQEIFGGMVNHALRMISLHKAFPDPRTLFESLTLEPPHDQVSAVYTPYAVHLRCASPEDFSNLYSAGEKTVTQTQIEKAPTMYGVCKSPFLHPTIKQIIMVTAENFTPQDAGRGKSQVTFEHELNHAKNRFYRHSSIVRDPAEEKGSYGTDLLSAYILPENCWDEGIAWSSQRTNIYELFAGERRTYDFVEDWSDWMTKQHYSNEWVEEFRQKGQRYIQSIVPDGAEGLEAIMDMFPSGIAREILRVTPFTQWNTVAKSLASTKGSLYRPAALR